MQHIENSERALEFFLYATPLCDSQGPFNKLIPDFSFAWFYVRIIIIDFGNSFKIAKLKLKFGNYIFPK